MTVWFVSRHPGAQDRARSQGLRWDRLSPHLAGDEVRAGDRVFGTLPYHLAARVCAAGAEYWHLQLALGELQRGTELSAAELTAVGARFVCYVVDVRVPDA